MLICPECKKQAGLMKELREKLEQAKEVERKRMDQVSELVTQLHNYETQYLMEYDKVYALEKQLEQAEGRILFLEKSLDTVNDVLDQKGYGRMESIDQILSNGQERKS